MGPQELVTAETISWRQPDTWGVELPPHRAHSATLVGKNVFVIGGGALQTWYDSVYILNTGNTHNTHICADLTSPYPENWTWSQAQPSGHGPGPRRAHTATLVGHKIYVFGGGDGKKALNDVYILDTGTTNTSW